VTGPVLRYPGAKWTVSRWIVSHFPTFEIYVEPFFGSGAVFFSLPHLPQYALLNDKSKRVVNLFEMLRTRGTELCALLELTPWARDEYESAYIESDDPLEDARRFLVRCWQAYGTRLNGRTGWRNGGGADKKNGSLWGRLPGRLMAVVERLRAAEIENGEALDVIIRFAGKPECLIYADPPYLLSTRSGAMYEHEMRDADHLALLDALDRHTGPVALSGYPHPLYEERLAHWRRLSHKSVTQSGAIRTEILWLNPKAVERKPCLFDERNDWGSTCVNPLKRVNMMTGQQRKCNYKGDDSYINRFCAPKNPCGPEGPREPLSGAWEARG
jgi:DNA adenine methylase